MLRRELASSLDDGTPDGVEVSRRFEELSKVVTAIIGQHHHELAVRLQDTYRSYDPGEPLTAEADPPSKEGAAAFSGALHALLRSAGFRLCSHEDETLAVAGHFGDEAVWNVPVAMDWSAIDESLVQREIGGFDAWAAEAAAGRCVARPTWADRLIMYHRGAGTLEKKGYYFVPKIEEMITRRAQALAARMLRPIARRVDGAWLWTEGAVALLAQRATRLGLFTDGSGAPHSSQAPTTQPAGHAVASSAAACSGGAPVSGATLQSVEITMRTLFEETTLSTPTLRHVLLAYRHRDAHAHAHANQLHIALALFRNVPNTDLDMLLPHTQVRMPGLQRAQFGAMGAMGLVAGYPLLHEGALSLTGLITLYTVGAIAARTAVRWRSAKQLYQQMLVGYQNSNRVGSSDGALLFVARLAEEEQTRQALLLLHALLRAQLQSAAARGTDHAQAQGTHGVDDSRGASALVAESRRVLSTWSQLAGFECHFDDDWRNGPLPLLLSMGVVERAQPLAHSQPDDSAEVHVRLRPLEHAIDAAHSVWRLVGAEQTGSRAVGVDCVRELRVRELGLADVAERAARDERAGSKPTTPHAAQL